MAHQVETMAYANAVPWHGLGAQVEDNLNSDEFLKAAGLDWRVDRCELQARVAGTNITVPDRYALVRSTDKKVLSVISKWWNPMQNHEMLDFMGAYVATGGAKLETAGSLKGGKLVWGLASLNHEFEVESGDRVKGYLLFVSPHEPGRAITIRTTTVRVVCANTLALAESSGGVNYSQTHGMKFNEGAARAKIGQAHEELSKAEENARIMCRIKINTKDFVQKVLAPVYAPDKADDEAFIRRIMETKVTPRPIKGIIKSMSEAPGAIEGNAWGAMNGVTHYSDHVAGRSADTRLASSWTGDTARKKLMVQERLLELA